MVLQIPEIMYIRETMYSGQSKAAIWIGILDHFCPENACISSVAYQKPFTSEANTMKPDQTAPKGAVWSGSLLFAI